MYKVFLLLIKTLLFNLQRRLYWLYRLSQADLGSNVDISIPFILEGKGQLSIEDKCKIGKDCKIGLGQGTKFKLGKESRVSNSAEIILNKSTSLIIESRISIGVGVKLYVNGRWIFANNVTINSNCQIFARESGFTSTLEIGYHSNIGDSSIIDLCADVKIGNNVAIGPGSIIYTHDHDYKSATGAPWKGSPKIGPVVIKDGAWIGASVIILPSVIIGRNAIVAAGAVVTKSVPDNSIYAGVPAKCLKHNYKA